jgi:hypothetical protein
MSSMLEQAIVDANSLREAAIKSAESAVVEKYSQEVKDAVTQILEQEDEELELGMNPDEEQEAEVDPLAAGLPSAHFADESDEDVVVIDLDDIIAAADAESDEELAIGEEEYSLDREELADKIGLGIEDEEDEVSMAPGRRSDDEVEIPESDLVDMFREMLEVDVSSDVIAADDEDEEEAEEEEEQEYQFERTDGMDAKDAEAHREVKELAERLLRENRTLKKIINGIKEKFEDVNLQNARLLYKNRVLTDTSLNEQQKNKIVDVVTNAGSVKEAKMIYETLQKTMATSQKRGPQSLSEVVTRRSSVILGGTRQEDSITTSDPTYNRWATLAGTDKN